MVICAKACEKRFGMCLDLLTVDEPPPFAPAIGAEASDKEKAQRRGGPEILYQFKAIFDGMGVSDLRKLKSWTKKAGG